MAKFRKVLLVEDDPITVLVCKRIMQLTGFSEEVLAVSNGQEALDSIMEDIDNPLAYFPDVIFLDINMPVMNGWEFLNEFSSLLSSIEKIPLLYILSSTVDPEDRLKGLSYSYVHDFISKPLTQEDLEKINIELSHEEK